MTNRIDRRSLLRLSGAGAIAAGSGGLAGILASGRAPAYAQTTSIHWVRWSDFVPSSDKLLREKILPEGEKALGMKIVLETINANDIQARVTAAIQAGVGPDIIMALNNWPQLYATSLADVSDITEEIGNAQGGYYDMPKTSASTRAGGSGYPGRSAAGSSSTANPGSPTSAMKSSRLPGINGMMPARNGRPPAIRSGRRSDTLSATRPASGTPICGRGAARRSRPTARLSR